MNYTAVDIVTALYVNKEGSALPVFILFLLFSLSFHTLKTQEITGVSYNMHPGSKSAVLVSI